MPDDGTSSWEPSVYTPHKEEVKVKLLAYGAPGVGKTTLAATASVVTDMSPVLYISAESGIMSIAEDWPGRIEIAKLSVYDFGGYKELQELFKYLAFRPHPYKTVVLDSLTEMQAYVVGRWKDHFIPKTEDGFAVSAEDDKRMMMKVYDRATDQLKGIVRKFRDLPMHVVMIAHDDQSEQNGLSITHPALTPAFRKAVVGFFDIVGYMVTREEKPEHEGKEETDAVTRYITFTPKPNRVAKDRSPRGKLKGVIRDPDMATIFSLLNS